MQAVSSASSSTSHYHASSTVTPAALFGQPAGPSTIQIKQEQQDPSASSSRRDSPSLTLASPSKLQRPLDDEADGKLALAEKLLQQDHNVILRPDLSSFKDVQDAIDRLMPYHIWNIPHGDLLNSLGLKEDPVLDDVRARKARRLETASSSLPSDTADVLDEYGLPDQLAEVAHPVFPSLEYAESLFARRSKLMERFKRTATALETTHRKAPVSSVSLEHLERMAYLDDRELVLQQIERLRSEKARLETLETNKGMALGTFSQQISLSFAITQEIEREREREREIERIKRQQERAAAKAAKLDKEREIQKKLGIYTPVPYSSSLANTPSGTPGGYFSPTPARYGTSSYATQPASNHSTSSPYGLPPTPTSASSALRPSGSFPSLSGPSTPSGSANGMSALSGLTPGPPVHRGRGRPRKHPLPGTPLVSAAEAAKKKKDYLQRPSPATGAQYMPVSPSAMTASSTPSYSGEYSSTLPPTPVGPGSMIARPPISTMHPTLTSATSLNNPRPSPSASASPAPSTSAPALTTLSAAQAAVPQVLNASALSNAQAPKPSIPNHPIPLLIPVTSLPRLSALGIQPVPSPHIRPVVGPDGQPSGLSGLPVPLDPNQAVAAILLGITEGSTETADGSKQQILHISVVLSKLNPTQLSGLAILMQSLQAQVEAEKQKAGIA